MRINKQSPEIAGSVRVGKDGLDLSAGVLSRILVAPRWKDAGDQRAQAETRWSRRAAEGASWAAGPLAQATPLAADGPASGVLSSPRAVDVAASASGIAAGAVTVPQV